MRCGWCKWSWEGILYLVKWGKTDGINVSLEMRCDASTIYMPRYYDEVTCESTEV